MEKEYLPIGTIVLLKNGKKELMITGYLVTVDKNEDKVYDYSGCLYPEGIITSNQVAVFNHSQIDKIIFKGFEGPQFKEFLEKLKEVE